MRSENRRTARIMCSIRITATPRAFMSSRMARTSSTSEGESGEIAAVELDRSSAAQRPRDAVHQRALARAVRPDEPDAFARSDREIDAVERYEAPEPLGHARGDEQRAAHVGPARRFRRRVQPMIPWGATVTNTTRSAPTRNRFQSAETLT